MKNLIFILPMFAALILSAQNPKNGMADFPVGKDAASVTITGIDINDRLSQYGLTYFKDGKVFYTSYKLDEDGQVMRNRQDQLVFGLYTGDVSQSGQVTNSQEFKMLDEFQFNSSTSAFDPAKTQMYVTTNESKRNNLYKHGDKTRNLRIEVGKADGSGGFTNFEQLSFCEEGYSYGHPAVSPDGKYLYFVSNTVSAKGPTDLFRVRILGYNSFGDVENLGEEINSTRKEMFPYVSKDNKLYFSSDRAGGIGGLDLYQCDIAADGTIGLPKLMPKPFNSRGDDMCFQIHENGSEGYLSSNRGRGKGMDDIYYFKIN